MISLRIFHSAKDGSRLNATCSLKLFLRLGTDGFKFHKGHKISDAFFKVESSCCCFHRELVLCSP